MMLIEYDRLVALYSIIKRLGFDKYDDYKMNIDTRILLQKQVFLLQEIGMELGLLFKWDVFGPYSKELADDLDRIFLQDDLIKRGLYNPIEYELEAKDAQLLETFKTLNRKLLEGNMRGKDQYEKFASIRFLLSRYPKTIEKEEEGVSLLDKVIKRLFILKKVDVAPEEKRRYTEILDEFKLNLPVQF